MKSVTRKRYTKEFKAQAVQLVGLGKPVSTVAEDLGISANMLYSWLRKGDGSAQFGSEGVRAAGEESAADELRRLRREVANLRLDNEILKKAAIILGTKVPPKLER